MCHFLAPSGQPEMMHENFMRMAFPVFVVCCLRMKFYTAKQAYIKETLKKKGLAKEENIGYNKVTKVTK